MGGELPQRFWAKTRTEDAGYKTPCIVWTGYRLPNGYGRVSWQGKVQLAHRVAYSVLVGPIPDGLMIDHLCRNRPCVNVEHMEPVTNRVNLLRGETFAAANAAKTHCPQGHPYDDANTIWNGQSRQCAICAAQWQESRNEARRAENAAKAAVPKPERTHCKYGHVLAEVGTYGPKDQCHECVKKYSREWKRRKRAKEKGNGNGS